MTPLDLFLKRLAEVKEAREKATPGPWKVEANSTKQISGDNWPVACGFGQSEIDSLFYAVTTDKVPASEVTGDAKTDAEFVILSRNFAFEEIVERMARVCAAADEWSNQNPTTAVRGGEEIHAALVGYWNALSSWASSDSSLKEGQ